MDPTIMSSLNNKPPVTTSSSSAAVMGDVIVSIEDGDMCVLPPAFLPGKWDVICQRGKECFEHGMCKKFVIVCVCVCVCVFCVGKPR
jgi:hypothetical protein